MRCWHNCSNVCLHYSIFRKFFHDLKLTFSGQVIRIAILFPSCWRDHAHIVANYRRFFKWTWRLLNFVREFILNVFLILIILVGVGIYFSFQDKPVDTTKGALLVDIKGTVVDKPSVNNKVRQWGRELLGTSSNRLQENSLFDLVDTVRGQR